MRPRGKTNSCRDWSEAGFLQQRRRFAYLNQFGDPGAVCFDPGVKVADALGQSATTMSPKLKISLRKCRTGFNAQALRQVQST